MEPDPEAVPHEELTLMESYYAGELSSAEADALRTRLSADPDLAALAAVHERLLRYGLRPGAEDLALRDRLRGELAREEAGMPTVEAAAPARTSRRRFPVWLTAAAVVVLAVAIWLLNRPAAERQLARENLIWVGRDAATLGSGGAKTRAEDALAAYDQKQYVLALPGLVEGVANGQLDSINLLYAGISAIGSGDAAAARELLTALAEADRYTDYAGEIRYNLALAELELGRQARAEDYLRGSAAAGYAPARSLLERLREGAH